MTSVFHRKSACFAKEAGPKTAFLGAKHLRWRPEIGDVWTHLMCGNEQRQWVVGLSVESSGSLHACLPRAPLLRDAGEAPLQSRAGQDRGFGLYRRLLGVCGGRVDLELRLCAGLYRMLLGGWGRTLSCDFVSTSHSSCPRSHPSLSNNSKGSTVSLPSTSRSVVT